jgi:FkbM family methyltransferase
MLRRARKIAPLLGQVRRYPSVRYYGAPPFVRAFGIRSHGLGKGFFSQLAQDELVFTEFFKGLQSGAFPKLFVDIGCNHPKVHSNSYFFETNQGYRVLAIDALREVRELWRKFRPDAEFVECAVGASDGELGFDVVEGSDIDSMFSSVSGASQKTVSAAVSKRTVKVRRIADILSERGIERAGIVSMDIEGYEFQALQGINFDKFSAGVFIIENNGEQGLGSNEIRDFMIRHGYVYFARIWNLDDIFVHQECLALSR